MANNSNRAFRTSWGAMEIEGTWIKNFLVGPEIKKEILEVMKFLKTNTKIAPQYKGNFKHTTVIKRGRWTGLITWAEEDVYFKELHFHYLSKMANKKYKTEAQLEAMRAKRRATYAARRRSR